jgi:hypothetical protein
LFNIPGLIIDAFGELRDQQEQVKEDMEVRVHLVSPRTFSGLPCGALVYGTVSQC